ncbi:MAG: SH3 domain-containing protein [Oscillospiraceae bacterium]|jgi:hypothetical protein|nr:SH3 domain-containing protein [Oscillospiraceae bacterium]
MPVIVFSSCGGDAAEFCNGAAEADVMGTILTQLQAYGAASGLECRRRPTQIPTHAVASWANRERADFLLLLRSAASASDGVQPGPEVCFHPASAKAKAAAELIRGRLARVYPEPERARLTPTPQNPHFRMAKCPAVELRLGCRDQADDAQWMLQSGGAVAHALAAALAAQFGVPCRSPFARQSAGVHTGGGPLALRAAPAQAAEKRAEIPNGAEVTPLHGEGKWQYIEYQDQCGYVLKKYIE